MRTKWIIVAALSVATSWLPAQPAGAPLTFEVASIKPGAPAGSGRIPMGIQFQRGGGLRTTNVTLRMLLTFAYEVQDFQITGGPSWLGSDLYDIQARSEGSADATGAPDETQNMTEGQRKVFVDQMRERLRSLLAERFQVVVHRETKEQPVYALVAGKGGPKLQESHETGSNRGRMRLGRGELEGTAIQLQFLAQSLSNQLRRPVLDKTGLTGNYDFKLTWTPDAAQGFGGPPVPPGADAPPAPDPNGPTIFTAVQEQLGLRLESQKGPVDVIVIDRAERPTEN